MLVCALTLLACENREPPGSSDARLTSAPVAGDPHGLQISRVHELRTVPADRNGLITSLSSPLDHALRRWLGYLGLLGVLWAAFFWSGYYIAKRAVAHADSAPSTRERDDKQ
jgi:hypothetical protein